MVFGIDMARPSSKEGVFDKRPSAYNLPNISTPKMLTNLYSSNAYAII